MSQVSDHTGKSIDRIAVKGFKSLINESSIEIKPLTILAGTNSSGKSSIMQPILLMKQTLASSYDPGALLLNGPHARFTSVEQLLSKKGKTHISDTFVVKLGIDTSTCQLYYQSKERKPGFQIERIEFSFVSDSDGDLNVVFRNGMSEEEAMNVLHEVFFKVLEAAVSEDYTWEVSRTFCFLKFQAESKLKRSKFTIDFHNYAQEINRLIHLPGLRGNPERTYTTTAVDELHKICRGTFEAYTASIVNYWQESDNNEKLLTLAQHMKLLGLADRVMTKQINDTEVEVFVSRTMDASDEDDWVSIADVGLGVSQTLPVAVALLFAEPGQLVYIEQPEIHLHPRAQYNLAKLLAQAAARGVKVVVETHSSILIRGIQTLVATDELDKELVALHWFTRNQNGETEINSAVMDEIGAFGDWPEDFAEVELTAEMRYLDAVENKEMGSGEEEQ